MHDACWKAIYVGLLIICYHLRKAKFQEGNFLETILANVVEPIVENVKTDIEVQK